jgi:DNA transposition AAA+ family ATPase
MNKKFVITKTVNHFVELIERLKSAPANLPKMALVYGNFGLGKSQTIMWWVTNNDAIYIRCNYKMSSRWLLSEIVEELDETPYYQSAHLFKQIEDKLKFNPKILVIDEVDFLLNNASAIEVVRDIHDKIGIPIILVGMGLAKEKLNRHKHIFDRLLWIMEFKPLDKADVKNIIQELCEITFTSTALELIYPRFNQFRQLLKLINRAEEIAKINNLEIIDENILQGILDEK